LGSDERNPGTGHPIRQNNDPEKRKILFSSVLKQNLKISGARKPMSDSPHKRHYEITSLSLPFARLRARTRRPLEFFIRLMNPCAPLLFFFDGL